MPLPFSAPYAYVLLLHDYASCLYAAIKIYAMPRRCYGCRSYDGYIKGCCRIRYAALRHYEAQLVTAPLCFADAMPRYYGV